MSITNILPLIEQLPHTDKFQLIQVLLTQLANEEGIHLQQEHNNGKKMATILQRMAKRSALSKIKDPIAWQQEIREDKPLIGRK